MKNLILTMVVALGLTSCNDKDKESEVLSRVDSIFTEVEAFMHEHRDNLDDNDPQTGKPFSEQIDTDKYLSAHYLALRGFRHRPPHHQRHGRKVLVREEYAGTGAE